MKRFILIAIGILNFCCAINAQISIYRMNYGIPGQGIYDYLQNFALSTDKKISGISFETDAICRGFVNHSGRWGFRSSGTKFLDNENFSNTLEHISNLTLGVEGWMCAETISIRRLREGETNTLDMTADGSKSSIVSNGDSEGLHLHSQIGHKIYLHNQVFFSDANWASMGSGRNGDPTIKNDNSKMFRIGSKGGIGIWGGNGVDSNDNPQLSISESYVTSKVPFYVIPKNNVQIFMGVAHANPNEAWIGTVSSNGLYLGAGNSSSIYLGTDRNVYVGLYEEEIKSIRQELKNKYDLFVNKGVLSEDFTIAPKSSWSDYVFQKNYNLRKLIDVEQFIKEKKHLPDIPSAKEVAEEGYSQHEMNKVLLQKVEELTLYVIELEKQVNALKAKDNK